MATKLNTPQNFTATPDSWHIDLTWSAVPHASSYEIYFTIVSNGIHFTETCTTTQYRLYTAINPDADYSLKVRAIGENGYTNSDYCTSIRVRTKQGSWPYPSDLVIINKNSTKSGAIVTASWTGVTYASGYCIQYCTVYGKWSYLYTTTSPVDVTGLARGVEYLFRVAAVNTNSTLGESPGQPTAGLSHTTRLLLPAPTNLTCTNRTETSLTFTWSEVSGTKQYLLGYKLPSDSTWTYIKTTTTTGTITGLTAGTTYNIIMGHSVPDDSTTYDKSPYSDVINVATLATQLPPPSHLTTSHVTSNSARVHWESVENASGYKVEYRQYGQTNWIEHQS